MLLTTVHFLKPFCYLAVRSSLMVELSGDLSTPYAKAHLVHNCGTCCHDSCCIMALSHRLTQRLHDYIESSPNKMYAHADCNEFGEV